MGYQRGDYRSGSYDEGPDQNRDRGRYERQRGYGADYRGSDYDDDRGFFDRAGDEVRSWFGDEEAERRRDEDRRRYENESGEYRGSDYLGSDYGGGRSERWRERGQNRDYQNRSRQRTYGGYAPENYAAGPGTTETFTAGSAFDSRYDRGRRFDRPDIGEESSSYGSFGYRGAEGASAGAFAGTRGGREYDPHYSEWRRRQIDALDRDYEDYRREHQSKFEQEFGSWRQTRQGKRQLLNRVTEHMEVLGSDGQHIGTVDKVRGDRIILTRSDPSAGGHHHSIPCDWVDKVEDKVTISKSSEEARTAWRDEESSRALFEREDRGSEGPHVLGRSFSGTYRE